MQQLVLQNILRFILVVLVQIFVLDNIQFLGYVSPMLYILFILSLPIHTPRGGVLLLAFFIGLIIDMFNNTMGMHAFATVFAAFLRRPVFNLFVSAEEMTNVTPSFRTFGVTGYVKYVVILVLIHHTVLFLVESFSFVNILLLTPKILISSLVTILLILGVMSFFRK
ncbi:MAG TPA: rod shape-determining protein MreD [Bacteroidales bacterium]|nr:rod shape-determining protein MreD [Bacteroidales bacterium]